ncbi:MAG: phosphoribosyltransferase family protein [archaeon]
MKEESKNLLEETYLRNDGKLFASWQDIKVGCEKIVESLRKENFKPDVIVAIGRGGYIPGVIISHLLENKKLFTLKVEFTEKENTSNQTLKQKPVIIQAIKEKLEGKKILLIDDVNESGQSIQTVTNYLLKEKQVKEIKTGIIHEKPWTKKKADFVGKTVDAWVVHPWEK